MIETISIQCPYCSESFETTVDLSGGSQRYIEDCAVCCRPIEIALRIDADGELFHVSASTDSE